MSEIVIHGDKVFVGKQVCVLTYRDGKKAFVGDFKEYTPSVDRIMLLKKYTLDDSGEKFVSLDDVMDVLRGGRGF